MKSSTKVSRDCTIVNIKHPAAILRANVAQRGMDVQRAVIAVRNAALETFK
jgi:hypothetical protein